MIGGAYSVKRTRNERFVNKTVSARNGVLLPLRVKRAVELRSEVSPFDVVRAEVESRAVGSARNLDVTGASRKFSPHGSEPMVAAEDLVEVREEIESGSWAVDLRHGDGAVEPDDRGTGSCFEVGVAVRDHRPVGRRRGR